jgi:hypothetical protein
VASGPNCLVARQALAQHVADLRESTMVEKGVGLLKTSLLSPKTILKKTAGDIVLGGVENLVTKPLAVGVDYLSSLARSAFSDKPASAYRDLGNALTPMGIKFGAEGFRDGLAKSLQIIKTGVDPDHIPDAFNMQRTTYDNPILNAVNHGMTNILHATVKPWFGLATNMDLYAQASANAIREGLSGAEKSARIDELLKNPTDEMALHALNSAEYATLTNKTVAGQLASNAKQFLKTASENPDNNLATRTSATAGYIASEALVPFTGVPSAIGGVIVDYSPVGAVKTLGMMIKAAGSDAPIEPGLQGKLSLGVARAAAGSSLLALGYYMARKGTLTGSYPTNPGERARWQAEGKEPYSFFHDGQWHSLTGMAPLGLAPLIGADIAQASLHAEQNGAPLDAGSKVGVGGAAMGKVLTEQSFLQGMSTITDMLNDPERKGPSALAGLATEAVPTVAKQIMHGVDPTVRQPSSLLQRIEANVPGLEQRVPAKLDQLGKPMTRGPGGITGVAREMLDVTQSHTATPNAATDEMDRLGVGLPSFGKATGVIGQKGAKATLTPDEYNAKVAEFGPIKQAVVESLLKNPDYQPLPDDEKKQVIENALKKIQQIGNNVTKARRAGEMIPRVTPDQLGATP